ncbi:MAG TPA: glycosyltransferase family 4 protein [Bryobacteraceae bacterium]|nr:glycosyltransferase family 4 protein [Bryobacteraceae bacterium]
MESSSSPVRLAYLLSQYPAVNHAFMLREVRLLREFGFEVQVASIRRPDRNPGEMTASERAEIQATYYVKSTGAIGLARAHLYTLVSHPIAYFRGMVRALRISAARGLFYFGEAVAVGDWMRRRRLSHVHTHYVSTVGLLLAGIFPVNLSITFHGPAEFAGAERFRLRQKVAASRFCCAISRHGLEQLMAASDPADRPKLELTPLGVDTDEFAPRPFRPNPAPFRIVSVGRLAPVKGPQVLIATVDRLAKRGRQFRLRLAGEGPDRPALTQEVQNRGLQEHVVFEGNLNQDELRELYRESDILVLASFAEGLPVVLMEAMAMEIPCVASSVNGVPEIITPEADGLLVPPGDADALAGAIGRLMDDPELRRTLGERARTKVLEKFNLRPNTEYLADVFRRRLAGR